MAAGVCWPCALLTKIAAAEIVNASIDGFFMADILALLANVGKRRRKSLGRQWPKTGGEWRAPKWEARGYTPGSFRKSGK